MTTNDFNADLHPRTDDGKFATKNYPEAEGGTATFDGSTVRSVDDVLEDIGIDAEYGGVQYDESGWQHFAWQTRLRYQGREMQVNWKAGMAITGEPTPKQVLESCVTDSRSIEGYGGDYADWGRDMGMDDYGGPSVDDVEPTDSDCEAARRDLESEGMDDDEDAIAHAAFDLAYARAVSEYKSPAERLFREIEDQDRQLRELLGDDYDIVVESPEFD